MDNIYVNIRVEIIAEYKDWSTLAIILNDKLNEIIGVKLK